MKTGSTRCILFALACLALCTQGPAGEASSPAEPRTEAVAHTFTAAPFTVERDSEGYHTLRMEGFGTDLAAGAFCLPLQTIRLALPPDADLASASVAFTVRESETLPGPFRIRTAPRPRANASALRIPGPAPVTLPGLQESASVPRPPVLLASSGKMRKWVLVDVIYAPCRYDPVSGSVTVAKQVEAQVRFRRTTARLDPLLLQDRVLDSEALEGVGNAPAAREWYRAAAEKAAPEAARLRNPAQTQYDLVIVTSNDIVNHSAHLEEFRANKEQHGFRVWIVTEDVYDAYPGQAPDTRADRIRAFLQAEYVPHGFKYVLLLGDPDPLNPYDTEDVVGDVPMKMTYPRLHATKETEWLDAPTDVYYSDLNGNWDLNGDGYFGVWPEDLQSGGVELYPEVFVGRIPCYVSRDGTPRNYTPLDYILDKLAYFEKTWYPSNSWRFTKALLPMSFSAPAYDGAPLGEEIGADLSGKGFTKVWTMYQQEHGACGADSAFPSSEELQGDNSVSNRWTAEPFGLVVWWGHGSSMDASVGYYDAAADRDCWEGVLFSTFRAWSLDDGFPSHVFLNSCLNGMPEVTSNLGFTLLQNGGLSTVCASRVSWFNPAETGNFRFSPTNAGVACRYAGHLANGWDTGFSIAHAREDGSSPGKMEYYMNALVFNLYGDPSACLRPQEWDTPPGKPTGLVITPQPPLGETFRLAWTDDQDAEKGYKIQYTQSWGSTGWVDILPNQPPNTKYVTFTNTACGAPHQYRVVAFNDAGETPSDSVFLEKDPCPPDPPPMVNMVTATLEPGGVQVSWMGLELSETGYRVYRRPAEGTDGWTGVSGDLPASARSHLDAGAACGTAYDYCVTAFNGASEGAKGDTASVTTNNCPPDVPSNLRQTGSTQTSITLAWDDNSDSEIGFTVKRTPTLEGGVWLPIANLPAGTTTFTDNDPPLDCGATRYYRVGARTKYQTYYSADSGPMTTEACPEPPRAPGGLFAHTDNPADLTHVYLHWSDNSDNESGFRVMRSMDSGENWTEIHTTGPNQTDYRDPSPCSTNGRYYRIRAFNAVGDSGYSNSAFADFTDCSPYAPVLTAEEVSPGTVELSWTNQTHPSDTTTSFQLYYVYDPYQHFVIWPLWKEMDAAARSTTHTEATCDRIAYYVVKAVTTGGTYASDMVGVTLRPCAPTDLAATGFSQTGLLLQWVDNSATEDGFKVERRLAGAGLWTVAGETAADVNQFAVTGLSCNTSCEFRVSAFSGTGDQTRNSGYTSTLSVTTRPCSPTAPELLAVTGYTQTSITLGWKDTSLTESMFRIFRAPHGGRLFAEVGSVRSGSTSFTDTSAGMACGKVFDYYVTATNSGGASPASNLATGGTIPCTPDRVAATALGPYRALLSWLDESENETGFTVQTGTTSPTSDFVVRDTLSAPAGATSLLVPAAACSETLSYRVNATGGKDASPWSSVASLTPPCAPEAPTDLAATDIGPYGLTVHWAHQGRAAQGFRLYLSFDGSADWRLAADVSGLLTSQTVGRLKPDTTVFFRATAYNTAGESPYSATLKTRTGAIVPVGGDINADGAVDGFDLRLLARILSGSNVPEETASPGKADLNGDGRVDAVDFLLLWRTAGGN